MLQHDIIRSTVEDAAFQESMIARLGTLNKVTSQGDVRWLQPLLAERDLRLPGAALSQGDNQPKPAFVERRMGLLRRTSGNR